MSTGGKVYGNETAALEELESGPLTWHGLKATSAARDRCVQYGWIARGWTERESGRSYCWQLTDAGRAELARRRATPPGGAS